MNPVLVKRAILGLLLLATIWLVINAPEPEVVAAVKPVKAISLSKLTVRNEAQTELFTQALPARDNSSSESYDIFAYQAEKKARPVITPKPVKPIITKPRKPTAPRLPFEYIGMLQQDQQTKVFLMKQQALYIVTEGDKIDGDYQLKSVTNDELRFIYLPLNATQTLSIETQS
jgi:hypothetical protein